MPAGRGDHECADRVVLAAHLIQIGTPCGCAWGSLGRCPLLGQGIGRSATKDPYGAREVLRDGHLNPVHQLRLARPVAGDHERRQPRSLGRLCDREGPATGADPTVERELTEERVAREPLARELAARRKHAARDREVEAGTGLRHIRGREVCRYSSSRELEP